jgi:phospholipid-binding lipoprotein MlaA
MRGIFQRLVAVACCLGFAGCASVPREPATRAEFRANNDPLEPLNRRVFAFNEYLDIHLIEPVAKGYKAALPEHARTGIRNFIGNLGEPLVFVNTVLQGRWRDARTTFGRLAVNTTAGFAGLSDVASRRGLPRQVGDFGQTLHAWGFGEGPYLVVPVLGPSNPRDLAGQVGDIYGDPLRYVDTLNNYPTSFSVGVAVVKGIDERAQNVDALDALRRQSIDYYGALRSLYRQHGAAEIDNGRPTATPEPANFYDDPASDPGPVSPPSPKPSS